jgi:16S rRNA (uracil1498-N3)-methyltransferase
LLAAAKQSMSPIVPEICEAISFNKAIQECASEQFHVFFWENEKKVFINAAVAQYKTSATRKPIALWVGPEGGFSVDEFTQGKKAGFIMCSLGSNTLRAETACLAGLLLVRHEFGRQCGKS